MEFSMRMIAIVVLLLGVVSAPSFAQTPPTQAEWLQAQIAAMHKSDRILDQVDKIHGLLGQLQLLKNTYNSNKSPAFRDIFGQYLSWYQTFVGNYVGAEHSFSIGERASVADAASPLAQPGIWHPINAVTAIAQLAEQRRAIFFNENHSAPISRTLTVELLAKLRQEGFNTFASETLYQKDMEALKKRGYPIAASGFYTREPVYAEMIRTALHLGYRVIAYEDETGVSGDARERQQAKNLYQRAFVGHPQARLVLNAGFAHVQKQGRYLGGRSMAEYFMQISKIDPLVIEQTMLFGHIDDVDNHPLWTAVIHALHPTQPIVFLNGKGQAWSLHPGAYDVSVFFPPQRLDHGRPTWLALGSLRQPYAVWEAMCGNHVYPCLIEARYPGEGSDAIPADLAAMRHPGQVVILWLRPGRYRLSGRNHNGIPGRQANIRVRSAHRQVSKSRKLQTDRTGTQKLCNDSTMACPGG